jgi:hypothetical protein
MDDFPFFPLSTSTLSLIDPGDGRLESEADGASRPGGRLFSPMPGEEPFSRRTAPLE